MVAAMTTSPDPIDPRRVWLSSLVRELFQAERAACEIPRLEAERLGDVPAALVLRAVADHAAVALEGLSSTMKRYQGIGQDGGAAVLAAVAALRGYFLTDAPLSGDRSYRYTLLRLRHGIDLVEVIGAVADADDPELARWCAQWLDVRRPLVMAAANQLDWFIAHPEQATVVVRHDAAVVVGLQAFLRRCQRAVQRLRQTVAGEPAAVSR